MPIERKTALTAADIISNADFEAGRKEFQTELRTHKQHRRVDVGPFASFFFESYQTMWWQIQEMMRVELRFHTGHEIARRPTPAPDALHGHFVSFGVAENGGGS